MTWYDSFLYVANAFVSRAERAFMDNAACVVGINSDCCEEFQF